jgi:hypothetical protein
MSFTYRTTGTTKGAERLMTEAKIHAASAELTANIATIKAAIAALDERREELSFDALATADTEAKKSLEKIHKERAGKVMELEDLQSALAVSKRKIAEAQQVASAERERERATAAEPIARRLAERGLAMDEALASYVANFRAIQADLDELQALGCPVPSRALVEVNAHRAHDSALVSLGDGFIRPVPPLQRHSFSKLLAGWALPARNWIKNRLNTNNAADAA